MMVNHVPPFNFYEHMKARVQKSFNTMVHFNNLFHVLLARFDIDLGEDTNIPPDMLMGMLMTHGQVGVREVDGKLWAFPGSRSGDVAGYRPDSYVGALSNIEGKQATVYDKTYNPEGKWVVIKYNATESPELSLFQYANILAEIDVSEKMNVLFSRFIRIPKVHDEKSRIAVKECIKNIFKGEFDCVVSDNTLNDVQQFLEGQTDDPFLDLVDVKMIDKLQYLNQYRDNIIKRFFQIAGQKTQVTSKLAQMSPDEVHANDSMSLILATACLDWIQKGFDEVNERFNRNWTIKFSKCWEDEIQEMDNDNMENTDEMDGGDSDERVGQSDETGDTENS